MKQNYARLIVIALSTIIQTNIAYGQPQNSIPLVDKATLGGELFF
ncbi:hypothetical protein [Mergibacter septicus]|nr:hypothetical protein [Mergibacter septicus]